MSRTCDVTSPPTDFSYFIYLSTYVTYTVSRTDTDIYIYYICGMTTQKKKKKKKTLNTVHEEKRARGHTRDTVTGSERKDERRTLRNVRRRDGHRTRSKGQHWRFYVGLVEDRCAWCMTIPVARSVGTLATDHNDRLHIMQKSNKQRLLIYG